MMMEQLETIWSDWILVPIGVAVVVQFIMWMAGSFMFWDLGWLPLKFHRVVFVVILAIVYFRLIGDALEAME